MRDYKFKLGLAVAREEKLRKKLESALAHEDSMREELGMVRKAVPNSTLELVSLQRRLTVAERERDAALAREDALRNDVLCLKKGGQLIVQDMHDYRERLTVAEKLLQRVHQADALSHCCPLWKAIDAALKPAAEPHKCIECESQYCHGVCVERGDDDERYKGAEGEGS